MIGDDGADGELLPFALLATTVKVYEWPSTRPSTVADVPSRGSALTSISVALSSVRSRPVTVYEVIVDPLAAGAAKLTVAASRPASTLTSVGLSGREPGTTLIELLLAADSPIALTAVTLIAYCVPLVRSSRAIGLLCPVTVKQAHESLPWLW